MNTFWRTFKVAAWLGWEMDSNWTEPWLFIVYSIIKPIAATFILILMYVVFAAIGQFNAGPLFDFMYVGNALFIFVGSTLFGTFQVIQSDREWYQTIRYIYISPISFYVYVMGRATSKILVSTFAVIITLAFGAFVLNPPVQISLSLSAIPVFVAGLLLGLFCLLAIGITLGGVTFLMARHTQTLAEAVPGIFYVFCGVLFPLTVLPGWLQGVGKAIPLTYWFDLSRRLLLSPADQTVLTPMTGLGGFSDLTILAFLAISSLVFFLLSLGVFKLGEYLARKAGKIDMTTSY
jgi:ABC-2 type transport system permease protein